MGRVKSHIMDAEEFVEENFFDFKDRDDVVRRSLEHFKGFIVLSMMVEHALHWYDTACGELDAYHSERSPY